MLNALLLKHSRLPKISQLEHHRASIGLFQQEVAWFEVSVHYSD